MKNKISVTILLLITFNVSYSQQSESIIDILTAKTWVMCGLTDKVIADSFDISKKYSYFNEELIATSDYYLSDIIEDCFDETKIGENRNGKYIICRFVNKPKNISVFEIIKITDVKLEIRNITQKHTLKYKAKE